MAQYSDPGWQRILYDMNDDPEAQYDAAWDYIVCAGWPTDVKESRYYPENFPEHCWPRRLIHLRESIICAFHAADRLQQPAPKQSSAWLLR